MNNKNDVEVLINGRKYTICGFESAEYLQKVATYINSKFMEFKDKDYYYSLDMDLRNILLAVNIADDYFKAKKQIGILEEDLKSKNDEVYALKHDLIAAQMKLENMEKSVKSLQKEATENAKQIVRMETELKERKGK